VPGGNKNDRNVTNDFARAFALLTQMGITIAVCIGLSLLIGYYLDYYLGTSPWLLLLFILFGIIAAIKSIFDFAKKH
jgi:ATP synthase protein I